MTWACMLGLVVFPDVFMQEALRAVLCWLATVGIAHPHLSDGEYVFIKWASEASRQQPPGRSGPQRRVAVACEPAFLADGSLDSKAIRASWLPFMEMGWVFAQMSLQLFIECHGRHMGLIEMIAQMARYFGQATQREKKWQGRAGHGQQTTGRSELVSRVARR